MNGRDALDLNNEGGEVTALLSALPRVEAPGNFEFGVRARIAAGQDVKARASLIPFLKLAAPLTLLLAITGFVFFYGTMPTTGPNAIETTSGTNLPAASPDLAVEAVPESLARPRPAESAQPDVSSRQQAAGPNRPANNSQPKRVRRGESIDIPLSRGGSVDLALGSGNSITPRGLNPSATEVSVRDLLGILGITAEFEKGGCKVRSVAENSLGVRAGLKAGDLIETIDGREVKSDTKLKGDSGKTFGIRRDGKRIDLAIGN